MIDFTKRHLAITDIETTGLDAQRHEIIELAVIVVDQTNLEKINEFDTRIKPENIKTASKKALEISGYTPRGWMTAMDLKDTMTEYSKIAEAAVPVFDNVYFDWSFIDEAFKKSYVEDLLHHRRIDLFTLAWSKSNKLPGLKKFYTEDLCKYFNIKAEPIPHRAINGAKKKYEILKKLLSL